MNDENIKKRLIDSGLAETYERLSAPVAFTDLSFLLVNIFEQKSSDIKPKELFKLYKEQPILSPCDITQEQLLALDHSLTLLAAPQFNSIEFSPLCPLGTNSSLANSSPKKVLPTIKKMELVADIGTVMALECAKRRQELPVGDHAQQEINICTTHRVLRLQKYSRKGLTPHFRAFALASAGRDKAGVFFSDSALLKHLRVYLRFLSGISRQLKTLERLEVNISDMNLTEDLILSQRLDRNEVRGSINLPGYNFFADKGIGLPHYIVDPSEVPEAAASKYGISRSLAVFRKIKESVYKNLQAEFPGVNLGFDLRRIAGMGHYSGISFRVNAYFSGNQFVNLADGGVTDWTQELLGSDRERFFVSVLGTEYLKRFFPECKVGK